MQIEEQNNYPKMICDLCIIQLNVSYNFKRLAIETAVKLDQFVIESGLNNNPLRTNFDENNLELHRPTVFTSVPVKTEVDDGDSMSEITIQTNTDTEGCRPNAATSSSGGSNQHSPSSSNSGSQHFSQFDSQSITMVQIGTHNIQQSATHSDIDFINHYMPANERPTTISTFTSSFSTSSHSGGLIVANAKTTNPQCVPSLPSKSITVSKSTATPRSKSNQAREVINLVASRSTFRPAVNPGTSQRHLLRSSLSKSHPDHSLVKRHKGKYNRNAAQHDANGKNTNRKHTKDRRTNATTQPNAKYKRKCIYIRDDDLFSIART